MAAEGAPGWAGEWSLNDVFGPWIHDLEALCTTFKGSTPFRHVQIKEFLNADLAKDLAKEFPSFHADGLWDRYFNPIEIKLGISDLARMPSMYADLMKFLCTDEVAAVMRQLTGITDLRADTLLHGAGLHCSPRGGKLDMHLDYCVHPRTGEERRLNLILYLTPEWNDAWGGALNLADETNSRIVDSFPCEFNTAGFFETGDISYHGFTEPVSCPPDKARNSLALYYVSDAREGVSRRLKAQFEPFGGECSEGMRALYDLRVHRRIAEEDVREHVPGWLEEHADDLTGKVKPFIYPAEAVTDAAVDVPETSDATRM